MDGSPEPQGKKADKGKRPPQKPIIVRVVGALKRRYHVRKRAAQENKESNERMMARWTRNVGLFTFALVVIGLITAGIFKRQLDVMQGQLDETQAEQRPILWAGSNLGGPVFFPKPNTTTGQVTWPVHFTNYGRGFINEGIAKSYIKVGKRPFEQSYGQTTGDVLAPIAPNQDMFLNAVFDLAGNSYSSSVCLRRLNLGAISYCKEDNQVK
jgi:hypothetical protein